MTEALHTTTAAADVEAVSDIGLLDTSKAEFYQSGEDFVGLRYNGRDYARVTLSRVLPYTNPDSYISVADEKNEEIGILEKLALLPEAQETLLRAELRRRYFSPEILEILSVRDKMGYLYLEVRLDSGKRTFALKDYSRSIKHIGEGRYVIFDVEGNRYTIEKLDALDDKSRRRIDSYLY